MPEPLRILDRAPRAETSFFFRYTAAFCFYFHAKGDLFLAINKTRTHPAHTQFYCFVPIHDSFLLMFNCGNEFSNYLYGYGIGLAWKTGSIG